MIDRLTEQQTAAIARVVMVDPELSVQVDIKLPESFVGGLGLPFEVLTDKRPLTCATRPARSGAAAGQHR